MGADIVNQAMKYKGYWGDKGVDVGGDGITGVANNYRCNDSFVYRNVRWKKD